MGAIAPLPRRRYCRHIFVLRFSALNPDPSVVGGKPTGLDVAGDGSVTVTTQDASGASSSRSVLIN